LDKVQELIDFALQNGLEIHGRTNPTEWAEELEKRGGRCPCGHSDACPCEDALVRIKNPESPPEDQFCGCTFYVSPAYLKHYGSKAWGKTEPLPQTKKLEKVTPEVQQAFLQTAKVYTEGLDLIKDGRLEDFTTKIRMEEATNPCDTCRQDADLVASHGDYVRALCKHGDPGCESEMVKLIDRTVQVLNEDLTAAGIKPEEPPKKYRSAWAEFLDGVMKDPAMDGKPNKYKMKIAATLYRKEYETIQDAMEAITE